MAAGDFVWFLFFQLFLFCILRFLNSLKPHRLLVYFLFQACQLIYRLFWPSSPKTQKNLFLAKLLSSNILLARIFQFPFTFQQQAALPQIALCQLTNRVKLFSTKRVTICIPQFCLKFFLPAVNQPVLYQYAADALRPLL